jgi:lipopolysaccharide/colanic/teichoic acid biosynthesis glycosyltransferase
MVFDNGGFGRFLTMRYIQLAIKRMIDLFACTAILIVGFPLLLLTALLVKITSPGPIFFVQLRVGKNLKVFKMIKFRTMTGKPDEGATCWTSVDEARITPIGNFLRNYGIDELPQVINIIRGDMSIVGPRPPLPVQVETYTPEQSKVFFMRPGVLSLAAIEGRRAISMDERIALHVKYIETWSLMLDVRIIWRCLFIVLGRKNATEVFTDDKSVIDK